MPDRCESCGAKGAPIKFGPFAGMPGEVPYCEYCYANLCPRCMASGLCSELDAVVDPSPDGKHKLCVEEESAA